MIDKEIREIYETILKKKIPQFRGFPMGYSPVDDFEVTMTGLSTEEVLDMRKITLRYEFRDAKTREPERQAYSKSFMLAPRDLEMDKVKYFGPHIGYVKVDW